MYDPEILKREGAYEAEEGCLSLEGTRKTTRYKKIKVRYRNEAFQTRIKTFQDFTAQIIQHECDPLGGGDHMRTGAANELRLFFAKRYERGQFRNL